MNVLMYDRKTTRKEQGAASTKKWRETWRKSHLLLRLLIVLSQLQYNPRNEQDQYLKRKLFLIYVTIVRQTINETHFFIHDEQYLSVKGGLGLVTSS